MKITESELFMRTSSSSGGGGPAGGGGTPLLFEYESSAMPVKTWQKIDSPNFRGDPVKYCQVHFFFEIFLTDSESKR
jgi:hypothetical protein